VQTFYALSLPAKTEEDLKKFKRNVAKAIAVDEVASMNRPDLYSIRGNTLLPRILAGDENQLAPSIFSLNA
jgi:hypothetical protein